jgi:hypothetical protein
MARAWRGSRRDVCGVCEKARMCGLRLSIRCLKVRVVHILKFRFEGIEIITQSSSKQNAV